MNQEDKNITWQQHNVTKAMRQQLHGHKSFVLWFTGLSGSGKSTIASEVEKMLYKRKHSTMLLDGDNVRHGLNRDLTFSKEARTENIRRIGEVAKLFVESGSIVLVAAISPIAADRDAVRSLFTREEFVEVYIDCSLIECEKRDPKGLYRKVREGLITNFTGISDPYEAPVSPEIIVKTDLLEVNESAEHIIQYLIANQYIS
ncbi:adenylyl-sulfate kinase [Fictibacillus phosphorivorans]|uniref:adenylyl-sulfate kinase n=1 Tax=Fictibacillus phosphorivorans TaxID=1221500 RepID=UPI001292E634|nr:adenylyl-sulfate kinase [Fictibacillus phosphorivorans]MQR96720.1 adenylyl-sulfate kinase [Fictibacillus phosphorivorans]